ncbi:MAG: tryptophan synthase subunit beta [Bacteroidetes bacterium HGW-Bacteroidetes-6]|nr:MAG: tryptophan synthase subunit beta [Bacteroidetes bacterium HGW-Bacteroidetes-6]
MKTNTIITRPVSEMLTHEGLYGQYGGRYVPPVLDTALTRVAAIFDELAANESFIETLVDLLQQYTGRPSPLYFAKRLSQEYGCNFYLKREDLNHTGSHKINNTLGQILLAKYGNYKEIVAETGAGQHGVATATVAAMFGLKCKIFMGAVDVERQQLNVNRMKLLGAEVITTEMGTATLKDAVDAALLYFIDHPESYYLLGSQVGPDPYPRMVGYFQSVIGFEARQQILFQTGKLPDAVIACIGGGSNAIGVFSGFLDDHEVQLMGSEGGGNCVQGDTAATLTYGKPAVFQGTHSYCLQDNNGEPCSSYSIAAGLDYPGISPQHSFLKDSGRATYFPISDIEAVEAFKTLSATEGIIPAIESSHALALAIKQFRGSGKTILINLSGRGDKDADRLEMMNL